MQVTKYPQSCLRIEKNGQAIVIDPGSLFAAKYSLNDLGEFTAVLYTHEHEDHFDPDLLKQLKVPVYANTAVAELAAANINVVKGGSEFEVAGFKIKAITLPHFPPPEEVPNLGYLIDDYLFHPGDSIQNGDITAVVLAEPISSHVNFEQIQAMIDAVRPQKVIPIHYSHPAYPGDPQAVQAKVQHAEVIVLADGESVEV